MTQRVIKKRNQKLKDIVCRHCGNTTRKKDGEYYCNRECYMADRNTKDLTKSTSWVGGRVFISGYYYVYSPDHPYAVKNGRYVAEHRLVAEKKIGRYLTNDEVAHHINGIKTDNRPENIEVMTKSEHSRHHQNFRKRRLIPELVDPELIENGNS